jgi:hypothetical protein
MRALSSMPFCPCDCRRVGLGYLSAAARDTTTQEAQVSFDSVKRIAGATFYMRHFRR